MRKGVERKEPEGENTETAVADALIEDEGNARGEGDAESRPVDETRDNYTSREREDANEADDAEEKAESRGFEN